MTELFNGLPLFEALIDDEDTGMTCISLVKQPATDISFLAFNKIPLSYSIQNEEKRLILGPIMLVDTPIYRRSQELGEYYITYSKDTVQKMAKRYLTEGFQNNISIEHNGKLINGLEMTQWFIKDSNCGISPSFFEDIPDGSLFGEFYVSNDEVWDMIKNKEVIGFSLEGIFKVEPKQEIDELEELKKLTRKIYKKIK